MGRLVVMSLVAGLALGCGGEKDKGKSKPPPPAPETKPETKPAPPPTPQELSFEFDAPADAKAPFDEMQNTVRSADADLRGCFTGTQATKANVTLVVVASSGTVESVSPSADREQAETCLKEVMGPLQFPTWDGDKTELKVKLAMGDAK